jgi:hypothetical protein
VTCTRTEVARQTGSLANRRSCRALLDGLSDRWDHTREVAARARSVAAAVPDEDRRLHVDAAWLQDIGYSPEVSRT